MMYNNLIRNSVEIDELLMTNEKSELILLPANNQARIQEQ